MTLYSGVPDNEMHMEPEPTELIEIRIVARVRRRPESYQDQITNIIRFVVEQFEELKVTHMNSPLSVRIKIKS